VHTLTCELCCTFCALLLFVALNASGGLPSGLSGLTQTMGRPAQKVVIPHVPNTIPGGGAVAQSPMVAAAAALTGHKTVSVQPLMPMDNWYHVKLWLYPGLDLNFGSLLVSVQWLKINTGLPKLFGGCYWTYSSCFKLNWPCVQWTWGRTGPSRNLQVSDQWVFVLYLSFTTFNINIQHSHLFFLLLPDCWMFWIRYEKSVSFYAWCIVKEISLCAIFSAAWETFFFRYILIWIRLYFF
jgi:hypothetical protein